MCYHCQGSSRFWCSSWPGMASTSSGSGGEPRPSYVILKKLICGCSILHLWLLNVKPCCSATLKRLCRFWSRSVSHKVGSRARHSWTPLQELAQDLSSSSTCLHDASNFLPKSRVWSRVEELPGEEPGVALLPHLSHEALLTLCPRGTPTGKLPVCIALENHL